MSIDNLWLLTLCFQPSGIKPTTHAVTCHTLYHSTSSSFKFPAWHSRDQPSSVSRTEGFPGMWGFRGRNPESHTNRTFGHPSSATQQLTSWPPDDAFISDIPLLWFIQPPIISTYPSDNCSRTYLNAKFSVMFLFLHFWNFSSLWIPKQLNVAITSRLGTSSLQKEGRRGGALTPYSWYVLLHTCVGVGTSHHLLCTSSSCSPIPYKGERYPLDGELGTRTMHCIQVFSFFLSPLGLAGPPSVLQNSLHMESSGCPHCPYLAV